MNRHRIHRARRFALACLALALMLLPATAALAQVPIDAVFSGFKRNGEFYFELDGNVLKHAEIYLSDRASSYLVMVRYPTPIAVSDSLRRD